MQKSTVNLLSALESLYNSLFCFPMSLWGLQSTLIKLVQRKGSHVPDMNTHMQPLPCMVDPVFHAVISRSFIFLGQ